VSLDSWLPKARIEIEGVDADDRSLSEIWMEGIEKDIVLLLDEDRRHK
jgi:hypothetical protein